MFITDYKHKSECDRNSSMGFTKSQNLDLDSNYAPKILGTLNQNFPTFSKGLKGQILKIETQDSGRWTTLGRKKPVKHNVRTC